MNRHYESDIGTREKSWQMSYDFSLVAFDINVSCFWLEMLI
ncbi:hypothetical protein HMPREF1982_04182 [Clostridiales bacterium oral taxon 876 str. F0540]|nr:hypothetical protein HMPREF1982_04182 [Clostridiales bacterium oral taxon 876 str. F0540]